MKNTPELSTCSILYDPEGYYLHFYTCFSMSTVSIDSNTLFNRFEKILRKEASTPNINLYSSISFMKTSYEPSMDEIEEAGLECWKMFPSGKRAINLLISQEDKFLKAHIFYKEKAFLEEDFSQLSNEYNNIVYKILGVEPKKEEEYKRKADNVSSIYNICCELNRQNLENKIRKKF